MNGYEYLNALREALEVLPEDERASAIRYYEEYFMDAGPENEAKVIAELGSPEEVAQNIVNEYTGLARVAPPACSDTPPQDGPMKAEPLGENDVPPKGFQTGGAVSAEPRSPWVTLLALLGGLFLLCTIGLPLLGGLIAMALGLAVGAVALLVGLAAVLVCVLVVMPVVVAFVGFALCVFSLFLWSVPASAALTLGAGLCLLAVGGLLCWGCMKLCVAAFRPMMRAGGWCIDQCGRFFRWCAGIVRRALDRIRGH